MIKHLYFLIFVYLSATFSSCGEDSLSPSIPPEKMVEILADVHMAEGALLNVSYNKKDSMRALYYDQIYGIHEVEEAAFRQDMEFYQEHPKVLEDLYELVIKHLGEMDKKAGKQ